MSYIGSTPTTQSFIAGTDSFNGTGSATNFTLSRFVNSVNDVQVVVNNVVQYPPNYSVSGNTLTISPAPSAGTNNVYVRYLSTTLQSVGVGDLSVSTNKIQDNAVTTAKIAAGAVIPADLSTGAPSWDTSGNLTASGTITNSSGQVIKNVVNSIRSTAPTLVTFGTSFTNINTTYYKWDLPSSGDYIVWCTVRSYLWNTNAFGKVRLYNNTAGAAVANSDTMLVESQTGNLLLNLAATMQWKFTASGATTLYLQGGATVAGTVGIQSDSNGYDEFGYIKVSV